MYRTVAIVLVLIMMCIITQSKHNFNKIANLRPKTANDSVSRNQEKLMIVFNGTCANSVIAVDKKIEKLLKVYSCLKKWEGIHKHPKHPNIGGIYEDKHGDFHAYFTIDKKANETLCIDNLHVDHEEYCIEMIDYEIVLKAYGCIQSSVYASPLPTYYRWSLDKIDGVTDNEYTHLDTSSADGNIDIYILDSGVLSTHYEFTSLRSYTLMDTNYSTPQTGHGTHVAGIMVGKTCGLTNHNIFDYPVCRGTTETCYTSYIEDAFSVIYNRLLATKRRGVINMSFGTTTAPSSYYTSWYDDFLSNLVSAGAIPVAAAGNEDHDACVSYPAASPYALGVGSHDINYNASSFSNYGSCVDIYAAGDSIVSSWYTSTTSYAIASGTSMASPAISGVVADMLWYNNSLTFNQIKSILQEPSNNVNVMSCPSGYSCKAIKISCSALYSAPAKPVTEQTAATAQPTTTTAHPTTTTTAHPTTTTAHPTTTTAHPTTTTAHPTTTTARPTTTTAHPTTTTARPTTTTAQPTSKPTSKPTAKPTVKPTTKRAL